jgi:hypothetical protein
MTEGLLIVATLLAVVAVDFVLRGLGQGPLTPGRLLNAAFALVFLAGYVFSVNVSQQLDGPGRVVIDIPVDYRVLALGLIVILASGAGSAAAALIWGTGRSRDEAPLSVRFPPWLVYLIGIPLVLVILGKGVALWSAGQYQANAGIPVLGRFGGLLAPAAMLLAGYFGTVGSPDVRRAAKCIFALYVVVLLAAATRMVALAPFFWAVGSYLGRRAVGGPDDEDRILQRPVLTLAATYLLMGAALGLRESPLRGVVPYAELFVTDPLSIAKAPQVIAGNIMFAVPLTSYVAFAVPDLPLSALMTSVSPLPSSLNGWAEIAPTLRVHDFIPYNALGEAFNYGVLVGVIFFFIAGLLLSSMFEAALRLASGFGSLLRLLSLGVTVLYVVVALEYNLRSAARFLWFALALHVLFVVRASRRPVVVVEPGRISPASDR